MRILIVAATAGEVAPIVARIGPSSERHELLVTGVDMVATAALCSRALAKAHFDVALNAGVCGSFDPALQPGTVVHVTSDRIAELGAEDGDTFLSIEALHLLGPEDRAEIVNVNPPASRALQALSAVRAITVNTVHGRESSIADVVKRFRPQVESMEGAAFMYACTVEGVRHAQIRAVSNIVERRNRAGWKLDEAIARLGDATIAVIEELQGAAAPGAAT
jgi:futalosine hydrolase